MSNEPLLMFYYIEDPFYCFKLGVLKKVKLFQIFIIFLGGLEFYILGHLIVHYIEILREKFILEYFFYLFQKTLGLFK